MNDAEFLKAYNASRNGTDNFYRHWAVHSFAYSEGVRECANEGIAWLVDIAATELPSVIRKVRENLATLTVVAKDGWARLSLTGSGDVPVPQSKPWVKRIDYTDLPAGEYNFLIADEGGEFRMVLVTEY